MAKQCQKGLIGPITTQNEKNVAEEIQHSRAILPNDAALTDIRISAETALAHAVVDKTHGFHLPALATLGLNNKPKVRHIILRGFAPISRTLYFYTDSRSHKISEIGRTPDVNLTFYDPVGQVQLCISGRATVAKADVAQKAWEGLTPLGRRAYSAISGTGRPLAQPSSALPTHLEGRIPEADEVETGYANFAVLSITYDAFDWLALSREGNRRAQFSWQEADKNWAGGWFVP